MRRNLKAEQEALKKVGGNQEAINQSVYGSATPVFEDTYGLPELQSRIDELTGKLDRRTLNEPKYLRKVQNKLKESRPYYGQTLESLTARYGTEGSDSYIKNPYERQALISGALNNSTQGLADYTAQMKELYGLETGKLTSQVQQAENAYNRALQSYQTGREEEEQRYNRMIDDRNYQLQLAQLSKSGSGSSGRSSSGLTANQQSNLWQSFIDGLGDAKNDIVNRKVTREDVIKLAQTNFPQLDPDQIANAVYTTYPDSSLAPEQQQEQQTEQPLDFSGIKKEAFDWRNLIPVYRHFK